MDKEKEIEEQALSYFRYASDTIARAEEQVNEIYTAYVKDCKPDPKDDSHLQFEKAYNHLLKAWLDMHKACKLASEKERSLRD